MTRWSALVIRWELHRHICIETLKEELVWIADKQVQVISNLKQLYHRVHCCVVVSKMF